MNSDGANTPPEPPIAIVRLVAMILPTSEHQQEPDDVVAADRLLERRIADAVQLRQREQHEPEQEPAGRRPQPLRAAPDPVGQRPRSRRGRG